MLFSDNCNFYWGGGEPTIFPQFNQIANFLMENNYKQLVNTSGIVWSEVIQSGLKKGKLIVQVSPDSGTAETFYKVKGSNKFNEVWNTINKYCEFPSSVTIKYIVFSLNSTTEEISTFIKMCLENNVRRIEISCESRSAWGYDKKWEYKLSRNEVDAAILLAKLAAKNRITASVNAIWSDDDRFEINEAYRNFCPIVFKIQRKIIHLIKRFIKRIFKAVLPYGIIKIYKDCKRK
jgi:molybdenum cofactor biosynthesis enzyme MoaA